MLTKSFFIDLHGCAKNQVDAEIIYGILCEIGWKSVYEPSEADLIIINSCGFIEDAKKESINSIIELRQSCPNAKIILAGCLAERYSDAFAKEMQEIDGVFGNGNLYALPSLINSIFKENKSEVKNAPSFEDITNVSFTQRFKKKVPVLKPPQFGISCGLRPHLFNFRSVAYIKITEGCNNNCSFCAIPLIRGHLRSRPIEQIILEIKEFIEKGIYEFNLVGQDLGVYGMEGKRTLAVCDSNEKSSLALLLEAIKELKGRFVVRLLYIHPDHFPLDILPIMASDLHFLPYFDVPFQSGADSIIKKMNRKGSYDEYLNLVATIKKAFVNSFYHMAAIRTTFLVGFPDEKDEDFAKTHQFLKELKCLWSGVFTYSREEDTKAFSMTGQVKEKVKKMRRKQLEESQAIITQELLTVFLDQVLLVLIEELVESEDGLLAIGRAWFQAPEIDGIVLVSFREEDVSIDGKKIDEGELVKVRIERVSGFDLEGVVCREALSG